MSLAASKGGIYTQATDPVGYNIEIVRDWQTVGQQQLTGLQLYQKLVLQARPIQLELGIGNSCGLTCQHCFLGYPSGAMSQQLVSIPKLLETVTDMIHNLGTQMIAVVDRDAITPGRSIPLFQHLAALRSQNRDIKFGGVTNGLLLHDYLEDLQEIHLDYLDISIDGTEYEHDLLRGEGKLALTLKNLQLALEHQIADRIIVASTLNRLNDDAIIQMIARLIDQGVRWFDIGPLMAVKMRSYQLHERDLVLFLESLTQSLAPIQATQPITILIELCAYCAAFIPALVDQGWLIPTQIRQDQYGHLYQIIQVNPNIQVILRPELIPEYWRHTLRISADGYLIGGCEPLTQENYQPLAIGNIQTESISALYSKALMPGAPFYRSMLAYDESECRNKSCFQHCLGGDSLLAKAMYGEYALKDPNCTWEDYVYQEQSICLNQAITNH